MNDVKQSYVLVDNLFGLSFHTLLEEDCHLNPGVKMKFSTSSKLFNLSRLKAKTKTTTTTVIEFQDADDAQVSAHSVK